MISRAAIDSAFLTWLRTSDDTSAFRAALGDDAAIVEAPLTAQQAPTLPRPFAVVRSGAYPQTDRTLRTWNALVLIYDDLYRSDSGIEAGITALVAAVVPDDGPAPLIDPAGVIDEITATPEALRTDTAFTLRVGAVALSALTT